MALILNIETSTTACSVALAENGNLLSVKEEDKGYTHAEKITIFIGEVFGKANRKYSELDAVAVSSGPGSYTGLRIGASTAKGLCYGLDKPLISVSTLRALAIKAAGDSKISQDDLLCPMIDARRMEVYYAVFDSSFNEIIPVTSNVIEANSFSELFKKHRMYFFGDGAAKCRPFLAHQHHAVFAENINCSAIYMVPLSYQKYLQKEFIDTSLYEPFYLKEVMARRSL
jgi:tRNA threonylcarbamoyladenosine biosynthesis protein TsaB